MSVLSLIDPSAASDQTKELLDGLQQRLGRIPNMIRVMAHSPTVLGGYLDFTYAMQRTTLGTELDAPPARASLTQRSLTYHSCFVLGTVRVSIAQRPTSMATGR